MISFPGEAPPSPDSAPAGLPPQAHQGGARLQQGHREEQQQQQPQLRQRQRGQERQQRQHQGQGREQQQQRAVLIGFGLCGGEEEGKKGL